MAPCLGLKEQSVVADIEIAAVFGERQDCDPPATDSRGDVIEVGVDRSRLDSIQLTD